jgi:L-threonylcarbamoyladenylate synthase
VQCLHDTAVLRVFEIKQRPRTDPLPILIAEEAELTDLVPTVPEVATTLLRRFWPGALTLIFRKGRWVPPIVSGGGETVAIRLPNHPIPRSLIRAAGVAMVGTSANIHGGASPVVAQHVVFELGDQVDMILDGGRTPLGRESTVVDVTQDPPRVVREGAIPRSQVEEALR